MILAYDIGNTNIVVGLLDGERIAGRWRFTTRRERTADEMRLEARSALAEAGVKADAIEGVAVASVVPALNAPLAAGLRSLFHSEVLWVDARTPPIRLDVDEPWAVGADRIVDCVAGYALYGGPLLVIDFGTAVTFNLISKGGAFLGGAIAPEMRLAADALTERAAQLFSVSLDVPESVIGRTTASNLRAGLVLGTFDLVAGLIARFRQEVDPALRVLATGGKGELYHEHIKAIEFYDPDLTLKGLRLCWEKARGASTRRLA
ncbi:MAG: type III pantothenate kinase [Candidatus Bipolaricaulota bacterium]|nr:type III pantothenate kinase [Candidatus Bipolaricaulota bacterium]